MKIGVYVNTGKDPDFSLTREFARICLKHGVEPVIDYNFLNKASAGKSLKIQEDQLKSSGLKSSGLKSSALKSSRAKSSETKATEAKLFSKHGSSKALKHDHHVGDYLASKDMAKAGKAKRKFRHNPFPEDELRPGKYEDCDFLAVLGGDGTFLSSVHMALPHSLPRFGINLGSVGFLPEVEPADAEKAVLSLKKGSYDIDARMLLEMKAYNESGNFLAKSPALNDVVVHRAASRHILKVIMSINGKQVDRIPGDGIIISAPTGSTAYSLAAGGPILHPDLDAIIITPIAPHTLNNRSLVCGSDTVIELKIDDHPEFADLTADGRKNCHLGSGYTVTVKKAKERVHIVRFGADSFFENLPEKIKMRGVSV